MKLLFDTHAFIWWDSEPAKLSSKIIALCQNPDNALCLSVVSIWEMQIKMQLNKLKLAVPVKTILEGQQSNFDLKEIPNRLTLEAFAEEVSQMPVFSTIDDLRKDLLSCGRRS
jgi:PIN domain nuclease of toxin-antitoxin system